MSYSRIGTVSSNGYNREVAYDPDTGKVDRQYGEDRHISKSTETSREVPGRASSEREALDMAQRDLESTFRHR